MKHAIRVEAQAAGTRLDVFLARASAQAFTRRQARNLCENAAVTVNGRAARAGYLVQAEDLIEYSAPALPMPDAALIASVRIHAETSELLVLEKPRALHSVEQFGSAAPALSSVLRTRRLAEGGGEELPDEGLLQRLDYWTSGLLLAAKTAESLEGFRRLMREERISKSYVALVSGVPRWHRQVLDAPIDAAHRVRVRLAEDGMSARSEIRVLRRLPRENYSLVLIRGRQMRRHQVRVHCAALGHPLLNDVLYSGSGPQAAEVNIAEEHTAYEHTAEENAEGFYLHARSLGWSLTASEQKASAPRDSKHRDGEHWNNENRGGLLHIRYTSDSWKSWPRGVPNRGQHR